MPDAVFGLEYEANGARTYRFFALETDRGTMPIARSKPGQNSNLAKLECYGTVLDQQFYRTHWGIPNLLALTLTTRAARASAIVTKLGTTSPAFLFKAVDTGMLTFPAPSTLNAQWDRAGRAPICIAVPS